MIKTDYYELDYDTEKNQIWWKIIGFWPSVDAVPNFDSDWKNTTANIPKGFTIMADLAEMKPFPPDVFELNQKKQIELMELGCSKVAQVTQSVMTVSQINRVAKESGMDAVLKAFDNFDDAQNWLSQIEEALNS
jgi:hypothetical protein